MRSKESDAERIFLDAVENHLPGQWQSYIRDACGEDVVLRKRVRDLLDAYGEQNSLLDGNGVAMTNAAPHESVGTQIGPYKLREQIGEGGFGVVYVAEQQEPVARKVALKIIKPGMDTKDIIARFEAERQALALMDHPNVAKVLDAGATESGRPYFVMELVHGLPITEFCDEQKSTNRERLLLFVDVCRAVQHAHQKGIIHRDLKPSNILVTLDDGRPLPKVIDFGVSKALSRKLTDKSVYTAYGQMVGTPLYMAPEQASLSLHDVDTRSDVYSLGVLLYELLTGTTPFDKEALKEAGFDELRRIIREDEPPRPSDRISTLNAELLSTACDHRRIDRRNLGHSLRGELDWIVMKALEKDRNRRYESANSFAADVERHLNDEPVQACPPSLGYRFRKFARRNRVSVALAGMAVVALVSLAVSGFVVASHVKSQAERDRQIAARRAVADARLQDALATLRAAVDRAEAAGLSDDSAWLAAQQARQQVESLAAIETANPGLAHQIREHDGWFEQFDRDRELLKRLEQIRLTQADTLILESRFHTETALPEYADVFADEGLDLSSTSPRDAVRCLAQRREEVRGALVSAMADWLVIDASEDRALTKRVKALLQAMQDDKSGTFSKLRSWTDDDLTDEELNERSKSPKLVAPRTLCVWGKMMCKHPEHWDRGIDLLRHAQLEYPTDFWINHQLGTQLMTRREHREEGVGYLHVAVALRPDSPGPRLNLGIALHALGQRREAAAAIREALEMEPHYLRAHWRLGVILRELGELDEAIEEFRRAIELDPNNSDLPDVYSQLGYALMKQGKFEEAIRCCHSAIELDPNRSLPYACLGAILVKPGTLDEASEWLHKAIDLNPNSAAPVDNLGLILKKQDKLEEAIAQHRAAIALDPAYALAHNNLGICLADQGKLDEAIRCYRKAIELDPEPSVASHAYNNLAKVLYEQGQPEEAIACYRQAIEVNPRNEAACVNLGITLEKQGKLDEAVNSYRQAIHINPNSVRAHGALGNALHQLGKLEEAGACYRQAVALSESETVDPMNMAVLHSNYGLMLYDMNRVQEAVEHHRKAIEFHPQNAIAHNNLGIAVQAQGNLEEAIACYQRAIEFDPGYSVPYANWGDAKKIQGDLDEAIALYRKAIEIAPRSASAHFGLGNTLLQKGEVDEAIDCYRKAIEIEPTYSAAYANLGTALYNKGDSDEAIQSWLKALQHSPDSLEILTNLSIVLATSPDPKVCDPQEALKHARRAVQLHPGAPRARTSLGVAAYRAGQWEEALNAWKKGGIEQQPLDISGRLYFAMTHWQLGNKAAARKWLEEAEAGIDEMNKPEEGTRKLQREAEELIRSDPANSDARPQSKASDLDR